MKSPFLSVILPVYKSEKFLSHSTSSILNQSFTDLELILVNDGSTDKSLDFCKKLALKDNRVKIVNKEKNEGRVCARRDGILQAQGKYISFIDHDDYMELNAFNHLCTLAKKENLDLVVGNYIQVMDNWKIVKRKAIEYENADRVILGKDIFKYLFGTDIHFNDACSVFIWGRIYRRAKVLDAMRSDIERVFPSNTKNVESEDLIFNLGVLPYIDSAWLSNEYVYCWRYGGASRYTNFHPRITGSGGWYFDNRFNTFCNIGFIEGLPRTFSKYISYLYQECNQRLHLGLSTKEDVTKIIMHEKKNRPIAKWAIDFLPHEYRNIPKLKSFLENDMDAVFLEMENQFVGEKRHIELRHFVNTYMYIANIVACMQNQMRK